MIHSLQLADRIVANEPNYLLLFNLKGKEVTLLLTGLALVDV